MEAKNKQTMRRFLQGPLLYLALLAIILAIVQSLVNTSPVKPKTLSYSSLLEWIESDAGSDLGKKRRSRKDDRRADHSADEGLRQDRKQPR